MDVTRSVLYGATGGGLMEALLFNARLLAWQSARHRVLEQHGPELPKFKGYVDLLADVPAALTRVLFGAAVGWLLASQISGVYAAVAAGASAPALIRQMGSFRSLQSLVRVSDDSQPANTRDPVGNNTTGATEELSS